MVRSDGRGRLGTVPMEMKPVRARRAAGTDEETR